MTNTKQVATQTNLKTNRAVMEADTFLWRQKGGKMIAIQNMETSHLVMTIKMIWNNTAPKQYHFNGARYYDFADHYTKAYFTQAIHFMLLEIASRKNLTKSEAAILMRIYMWVCGGVCATDCSMPALTFGDTPCVLN